MAPSSVPAQLDELRGAVRPPYSTGGSWPAVHMASRTFGLGVKVRQRREEARLHGQACSSSARLSVASPALGESPRIAAARSV